MNDFQTLCKLGDCPPKGQALSFNLDGQAYIVAHHDTGYSVFLNRCPHRYIPLEWQPQQFIDDDTGLIHCSSHGALFLLDSGHCVSGPCAGDSLDRIESRMRDGDLQVKPVQSIENID